MQVLAANIDAVFVVHPIAAAPNLRRIERELALAWDSGAVPVVVLTKADLSPAPGRAAAAVMPIAPGVDVHVTSATTGEGVAPSSPTRRGTGPSPSSDRPAPASPRSSTRCWARNARPHAR